MAETSARVIPDAASRREKWRDNQQQSIEEHQQQQNQPSKPSSSPLAAAPAAAASAPAFATSTGEVFKFDSFDRDRFLGAGTPRSCGGVVEDPSCYVGGLGGASNTEEGCSGRSPHSSLSSPQISVDSPRISFSPLRIKDSIEEEEETSGLLPTLRLSRPLTPITPCSPKLVRHLPAYLTHDIYHRRCLSDTDLSSSWEDGLCRSTNSVSVTCHAKDVTCSSSRQYLSLPTKGGSLESDASTSQECPLDLSIHAMGSSMDSIQQQPLLQSRGRGRSHGGSRTTSRASSATYERYSLDRLDSRPLVDMPAGSGSFVCPVCGQMFSLGDRLAKHMASRHKSRSTDGGGGGGSSKAYGCDVCKRSFARSDMLTRHMRLHTGVKPYTCRVCGQVFSRSDHLSTHQRTHTGEKPYRCPSCPYAACRRDMITRHMRTHARYDLPDSAGGSFEGCSGTDSPGSTSGRIAISSSRSVSVESSEQSTPPAAAVVAEALNAAAAAVQGYKPQSPMDTGEEAGRVQ